MRAKFKVESATKTPTGDACDVALRALTEHDQDNEEFWKYTPAGYIQMYITNPAAFDKLAPGQVYYVDFTQVS